ncbi:hypothetical protein CXB51_027255 [Gossypium anomalum]|uniref:CCAAT-binding factor domain-containing protein n=1 Tax=Gossypium anomalum TaxID=47600 RepID=A0A8J5YIJ9_9ROSI|nr:hypothetical protein CXB51_027255 [Gossypium anomalum]
MSNSKTAQDVELLKSDIASFASSLGFSADSSLPYSGFNDVDFRKAGPLKPPKPPKTPKQNSQLEKKPSNTQTPKTDKNTKNNQRPKPNKPPVLSLDDSNKSNRFSRDPDKFKNLPALPLVKASALSVWYEDESELEKKLFGEDGKGKKVVSVRNVEELKRLVEKKMELGERLMWQYAKDCELSKGKSGDMKMVLASQRSGTAADKVSAFSFVVADNPVANLKSLDGLLGLVTSKVGKRYAFTGFEALKELFISNYSLMGFQDNDITDMNHGSCTCGRCEDFRRLLPDRKLKTLIQRPVDELPETKDGYSLLLFWYWEDCLKQRYERFVVALEEASRDMLPALKDKALKTMYVLLKSKPEQERKLLSSLVNKLGDPQNKGASNADYYLSNLLSDHPNMKAVVIDEVDTFLFRPHLGLRAKYHAVNFLSQIRLSHKGDGPRVAKRLIEVYFALFKVLISEAEKGQPVDDKSNKAVKSTHKSKENKRKGSGESHVELDSRLLSALLMGVNRAFPYVSSNEADDIVDIETPILFQLVHSKNFNVGVQALMLLDKISSKNQAEMFIGLLLRAMKSDVNLKRVSAFSKRILQVALQQPPQYACGCLFLISEVLKARPQLWNMMLQNESVDEDLEHFEDIVEETASGPSLASKKEENNADICGGEAANSDSYSSEDEGVLPSSYSDDDISGDELFIRETPKDQHHQEPKIISNQNALTSPKSTAKPFLPGGYDPRHREPSYSNADRASWWELMILSTHVHPSVATMAATLLSGANIVYNGNPLNDLSLTAFLDKFMEKKPKASSWHGGSQIEPAKKLDMNNYLIGQEILSLAETDVPPEDLVFHKFYMNKMNSSKKPKKKKKKAAEGEAAEELFDVGGNDVDDYVDGGDDSDNEEIENILDSANPSLDADGDYDYDALDNVANEDDDDLIGDASDAEMDIPSDDTDGEGFDVDAGTDSVNDDGDDAIAIGDADDLSDGEDEFHQRKRKRKSGKKTSASPFASLEDYEHLLNEDSPTEKDSIKTKKFKPRKKKLSK